jgi:hypothetical protein
VVGIRGVYASSDYWVQNDIALGPDGSVFVTGTSISRSGIPGDYHAEAIVAKFDAQGVRKWLWFLPMSGHGRAVAANSKGSVFVSGVTIVDMYVSYNVLIAKVNADGKTLWTAVLDSGRDDQGSYLAVDPAGDVYVAGWTNGSLGGQANNGSYDIFLAKFSGGGEGGDEDGRNVIFLASAFAAAELALIVVLLVLWRRHRRAQPHDETKLLELGKAAPGAQGAAVAASHHDAPGLYHYQ